MRMFPQAFWTAVRRLRTASPTQGACPLRAARRRLKAVAAEVEVMEDRCLLSPLGAPRGFRPDWAGGPPPWAGGPPAWAGAPDDHPGEGRGPESRGPDRFDQRGPKFPKVHPGRIDSDFDPRPSGDVSVEVENGDLVIFGGEGADRFEVAFDPALNEIVITGTGGTLINGETDPLVLPADGIENLFISTGESTDTVVLMGLDLAGDLTIDTGEASDVVAIVDTSVGGDLLIETGEAHDLVALQNVVVSGDALLDTGEGHDTVLVDDAAFEGEFAAATGEGHDTVLINASAFTGFASVETGDGHDLVALEDSSFEDGFFIEADGGHDVVAIFSTAVVGDLQVELGGGHDTLVLDEILADGEVLLAGGGGRDLLVTDLDDLDVTGFEKFDDDFDRDEFFDDLEDRLRLRRGELDFDALDDAIDLIIDEIVEALP